MFQIGLTVVIHISDKREIFDSLRITYLFQSSENLFK